MKSDKLILIKTNSDIMDLIICEIMIDCNKIKKGAETVDE